MAPQALHTMKIGNTTIGWWGAKNNSPYKSVAANLGVTVNSAAKDVVMGARKPRPCRVRFTLDNGKSRVLFCHPDKANAVVNQNSCKGKAMGSSKVKSAGFIMR